MVPILGGFTVYGILKMSYYLFQVIFIQSGIAFLFEITTFAAITSLYIPQLIAKHYDEEFWKLVNITKQNWAIVVLTAVFCSLLFISTDSIVLFSITFTRTGLGNLSFGSLIQAPIFEEYLFRGVILGFSLKFLENEEIAMRLNGLLFGLWHIGMFLKYGFVFSSIYIVVTSALFGYLLAKIHVRKNNLLIPIALHSLATLMIALTGFPKF